jgi:hypothetical protein
MRFLTGDCPSAVLGLGIAWRTTRLSIPHRPLAPPLEAAPDVFAIGRLTDPVITAVQSVAHSRGAVLHVCSRALYNSLVTVRRGVYGGVAVEPDIPLLIRPADGTRVGTGDSLFIAEEEYARVRGAATLLRSRVINRPSLASMDPAVTALHATYLLRQRLRSVPDGPITIPPERLAFPAPCYPGSEMQDLVTMRVVDDGRGRQLPVNPVRGRLHSQSEPRGVCTVVVAGKRAWCVPSDRCQPSLRKWSIQAIARLGLTFATIAFDVRANRFGAGKIDPFPSRSLEGVDMEDLANVLLDLLLAR